MRNQSPTLPYANPILTGFGITVEFLWWYPLALLVITIIMVWFFRRRRR